MSLHEKAGKRCHVSKYICSSFRSNEICLRREFTGLRTIRSRRKQPPHSHDAHIFISPLWYLSQRRKICIAGPSWGQKPSKQPRKQPRKTLLLLPEPWSDMIDRVCVILLDTFHLWPHLFSQESARFHRRWPTIYFLDLASHQWFLACRCRRKVTRWWQPGALQSCCFSLQWLRKA